jgi:pimeloyl-ACP methyl ester carboxylesterase
VPVAREVRVAAGRAYLQGSLALPKDADGVVLFAHGSGSSRHSPRNRWVAQALFEAGIGSLLFDLLAPVEEEARFDIGLLAERLEQATRWLADLPEARGLRIGYFGASTGAAAALVAAARLGDAVDAVVSRGGRPDLAGPCLPQVMAPTLLIVGSLDREVLALNQRAYEALRCTKAFHVVPGASHLFEEPGTLERVAELAAEWFRQWLSEDPEHVLRSDEDEA